MFGIMIATPGEVAFSRSKEMLSSDELAGPVMVR